MDHGIDIERRAQKDLIRLAKEMAIPFIATNDLHYTAPEDAKAHEVLLCVQSGKTMADPQRFKFDAQDFYLKSPREMRELWREFPEACDNTLLIAERCEMGFDGGRRPHAARARPRRLHRGHLAARAGPRRAARALRRRPRAAGAHGAGRLRGRRHRQDGLPRLLPRHGRPVPLRQGDRHPRRPGPRLGRRLAGGLRAARSPTSTRSSTSCCSSASSTPSASRCPTSTSTSTSAGAAT